VNWQDKDEVKEFYSNLDTRRKVCIKLVRDAAFLLGEILGFEAIRKNRYIFDALAGVGSEQNIGKEAR
jgi:hypothetical protein